MTLKDSGASVLRFTCALFTITAVTLVWPPTHVADNGASAPPTGGTKLDDVFVRDSAYVGPPVVELNEAIRGYEYMSDEAARPQMRGTRAAEREVSVSGVLRPISN